MHNRNSGNLVRKLRSQVRYKIEKGKLAKMSLFFKNSTTYLEVSHPFVPLADVENSGTFPAFQETKTITNSKLNAE